MKNTTQEIENIIINEEIIEKFREVKNNNPGYIYNERTIEESFDLFVVIKKLIKDNIKNGYIDKISNSKRNDILSYLNSIISYINNNNNVSSVINYVDVIYDYIVSLGFPYSIIGKKDYNYELNKLSELEQKINDTFSEIISKDYEFNRFEEILKEAEKNKEETENILSEAKNNSIEIDENLDEIIGYRNTLTRLQGEINELNEDIETKKLAINTFYKNIDEYKKNINELEESAYYVINREPVINDLINQAEKALELKSTEGISAAFNTQYNKKRYSGWWIVGSSIFIAIAILMTIWIVGGWWIKDPNSLNSIIGRIAAVIISISGATFCTNQYIRLKNIKEDYAYKSVLAKSIIAFTNEIKKRDETKVPQYLDKVLYEIHRDPLRKKENKNSSIKDMEGILEKILDKVSNLK